MQLSSVERLEVWSHTHAWYVLAPDATKLVLVQTRKEAERIAQTLNTFHDLDRKVGYLTMSYNGR